MYRCMVVSPPKVFFFYIYHYYTIGKLHVRQLQ